MKFEGIPESFETSAQQSAPAEDTRKVLVNFFEDALGTEDPESCAQNMGLRLLENYLLLRFVSSNTISLELKLKCCFCSCSALNSIHFLIHYLPFKNFEARKIQEFLQFCSVQCAVLFP